MMVIMTIWEVILQLWASFGLVIRRMSLIWLYFKHLTAAGEHLATSRAAPTAPAGAICEACTDWMALPDAMFSSILDLVDGSDIG